MTETTAWFLVENGVLTRKQPSEDDGLIELSAEYVCGQLYDGTTVTNPPPSPHPVPEVISDRQFFQQLAIDGLITQAEALAAVKVGTVPAAMQTFINALPADQQFNANMVLAGATEFRRSNQLVSTFGAAQGMTSDQIDALWIAAAALL